MLRNIGRLHRSTDASNIPFIGEASYDLEKEGLKYSRVHRAKLAFPRAATGTPSLFTGTSVIEIGHALALMRTNRAPQLGALQYFSVSTEDRRSIAAVRIC